MRGTDGITGLVQISQTPTTPLKSSDDESKVGFGTFWIDGLNCSTLQIIPPRVLVVSHSRARGLYVLSMVLPSHFSRLSVFAQSRVSSLGVPSRY